MASYTEGSFKKRYKIIDRKTESSRIRKKYPDRIPIIVEHSKKNFQNIPTLDKQKYLVPGDLTIGQFAYVIRKRIKLSPEKAMFMLINNKMINTSEYVTNVYDNNADEDGFLYVVVSGESTFG
jgi:GABA(A) receptor-associated protein